MTIQSIRLFTLSFVAFVMVLLAGTASVQAGASLEENQCRGAGGTWSAPGSPDGNCTFGAGTPQITGENSLLRTVTNILLFIVGAAAVIAIVINGLRLVTSGSDPQAVASARQGIIYGLVGVVVAFLAFAAVSFVADEVSNPSTSEESDADGG